MKLAIDGDLLVYKACYVTEYQVYDLPDVGRFRYRKEIDGYLDLNEEYDEREELRQSVIKTRIVEPVSHSYHIVDSMVDAILNQLQTKDYTIYLSGKNNFREKVPYPVKYKGNRVERPIHLENVRGFLLYKYKTVVTDGYEADDALGIMASTQPDVIICSSDKDLNQVPGKHYNLDSREIYQVDEMEGYRNYNSQLLTGDKTDNILGIPKIGPVKASKLLEPCTTKEEMDAVVLDTYKKAFPQEWEQLLDSTRKLVWILREEPKNG